ncbi:MULTISPECIES: hypothetical protein [Pelosinus]|uniref:hypothetical protein n=1 Tax=Pelosinus TaxID=365348 RepID=UPI00030B8515|nr:MULTISPECIES: hypothetical protein [Pelosinus]
MLFYCFLYLYIAKVAFSGIVVIVAEDGTLIAHTNKDIIKEQKKIPKNLMKRFKEQSAAMQEISSSSQGLANLAGDLQHSVHQFKIGPKTRKFP